MRDVHRPRSRRAGAGVLVAALALASGGAATAGEIAWGDDVRDALRRAQDEGRPVVVDVWAVWCAPCRHMEETTYADVGVIGEMGRVVPLKIDADANAVFVERYRAGDALPTTLFLDGKGREIARRVGAIGPRELSETLRTLADGYGDYARDVAAGDDPDALRAVARYLGALGNPDAALRSLERARKVARKRGADPTALEEIEAEIGAALAATSP